MSERRKFIIEAFMKAVGRRTGKSQRLHNGLFMRQQFQQALAQGNVPVHPRWEWLRRQSRTMLELLIVMAKDYDKLPGIGDKSSMLDLIDICDMTRRTLQGAIQLGIMDPDDVVLIPFEEVKGEVVPEPDPAAAIKGGEDDEGP